MFKEASTRMQAGDHDLALDYSLRAFDLLPNPLLAMHIGTLYRALGQPHEALIWYQAASECGLDEKLKPKLDADVESVKAESGRIEIRFMPRDTAGQRYVDGEEIDPTGTTYVADVWLDGRPIDASTPIYVAPGEHQLRATNSQGLETSVSIEIRAGESQVVEIELPPPIMPHVCLSPIPCLQPPPPDEEFASPQRFNLDLGGVGLVDVDRDGFRNHGFGGQLALAFSFPLGETGLRSAIGIEATPAALRSGFFMPAGVRLEALVPFARRLTVGVGIGGGYTFADGDASSDGRQRPKGAPYLEPYLPFGMRLGSRIGVGIRPGLLFTEQSSVSDESFGLGFFRMGVFLRYSFSPACDEDRDSDCRMEPLREARYRPPDR